jgi:N-acetyl-gamma-glutamyl-phosphate/LysW-gamma-L-alpha-aminoadipyl-6-phosphate reductase
MLFKPKKKINAGIIGGAGYGGAELIKLLLFHPRINLVFVTSRRHTGKKVSSVNRFLEGVTELEYIKPDIENLTSDMDMVFLATPHGTSMHIVPQIIKNMPKARIIDLSGDFRLKNPSTYKQYYGKEHSATDLLGTFVYGLPELNRDPIRKARYIANPGCFATGVIFALYPLCTVSGVVRDVSIVAVTGSSGSGELPKEVTHHPIRETNFKAYKILEHQHIPEIEQFFKDTFINWDYEIGMVPQSGPFVRGIFTTVTVYNEKISSSTLHTAFSDCYGGEHFIRVVEGSPEINPISGTNYVEVSCACRSNFVVAMSAIDNLVRGASGQAVQNMNIMFGFDEDEGLQFPGQRP